MKNTFESSQDRKVEKKFFHVKLAFSFLHPKDQPFILWYTSWVQQGTFEIVFELKYGSYSIYFDKMTDQHILMYWLLTHIVSKP